MAQILLPLFLFCVSLLPAAYLRYYPFRSIVRPSTRHFLLCGHLYIFLFEFVLLAGLFGRGLMKFETGTFQFLYYFCYLPICCCWCSPSGLSGSGICSYWGSRPFT